MNADFQVTINEWSMYINIAYRFLIQHSNSNSNTLHPFIDSWSHHITSSNMHRALSFPSTTINASSVLLVEGDFTTVFSSSGNKTFDIILTYFFIDTARNLMAYFDTIHRLLKPGGLWINFGPLLYGTGPFVQLSLEEIVAVTKAMGFEYVLMCLVVRGAVSRLLTTVTVPLGVCRLFTASMKGP